jgi:endonuclease YncB( thermonuclease family)
MLSFFTFCFRSPPPSEPKEEEKVQVQEKEEQLPASIAWEDTIPFIPPLTSGRVIKVYDGDTITIANYLPLQSESGKKRKREKEEKEKKEESVLYRFAVRLNGIDCPELKSGNPTEKECALQAQKALSALILNKDVELRNVTMEKYGRLLADVYIGDLHLNQYMIDHRWAVPYSGKTKQSPPNWMEYHSSSSS